MKYIKYIAVSLLLLAGRIFAQECMTLQGQWVYGPCNTVDATDSLVAFGVSGAISVAEFNEDAGLQILGQVVVGEEVLRIRCNANSVYALDSDRGFCVIDISNPRDPTLLRTLELNGGLRDLVIDAENRLAFVAADSGGLYIIDISDRRRPGVISTFAPNARVTAVTLADSYALIGIGVDSIVMLDVSNAREPREVGRLENDRLVQSLVYRDSLVYVANGGGGLRIISIADPDNVIEVSATEWISAPMGLRGWASSIVLVENTAYLTDYNYGVIGFDVSNPSNPDSVAFFHFPPYLREIKFYNNKLFLSNTRMGFRILDIQEGGSLVENVWYLSRMSGRKIVQSENTAAIEFSGIMPEGTFEKIDVFDITNPRRPSLTGTIPTHGLIKDICLVSDKLFVGLQGDSSVKVFDLDSAPQLQAIDSLMLGAQCRAIQFDQGVLYVAQTNNSIMTYDITDLDSIAFIGGLENLAFAEFRVADGLVYSLASAPSRLQIHRILNQNASVQIGECILGQNNYVRGMALGPNSISVVTDRDGVLLIDITDPTAPNVVWDRNFAANVQNTHIRDTLFYVESFLNGDQRPIDGIRLYNISDLQHPEAIGYYDDDSSILDLVANGAIIYAVGSTGFSLLLNDLLIVDDQEDRPTPSSNRLIEAYPNPFNSLTTITFGLDKSAPTCLAVYDISGRKVADLLEGIPPIVSPSASMGGKHSVVFDASGLPAGVYLLRLEAGELQATRKLVLMK